MEKQQVSILLVFGLNQQGLAPTIYVTGGERVSHDTIDGVFLYWRVDLSSKYLWLSGKLNT